MSNKYKYIIDFNANTQQLQKQLGGVNSMMKSVGVAAAAAFSVGAIMDFAKQSIVAYDTSIKNETALLVALKGRSDIQQSLIQQASELQDKTLFEDDETVRAQSLVAAFVKEEEKIRTLIPLIQDMATAKSMDLAGAADLVTKTLAGEMNALGRYGIQVTGAAGSTERLISIQKGLNDAFGGQAEAAAKVGTAAITQLQNAYGDLGEVIGKLIIGQANQEGSFVRILTQATKGVSAFLGKFATASEAGFGLKTSLAAAIFGTEEETQKLAGAIAEQNAKTLALAESSTKKQQNINVELKNTYGSLAKEITELTAKRAGLSLADTQGITAINAEIFALQRKQQVMDDLGKMVEVPEVQIDVEDNSDMFSGIDKQMILDLEEYKQKLDEATEKNLKFQTIANEWTPEDTINSLSNSFSVLGANIGGAAGQWMSLAGNVLGMIPQLIAQITALGTAQAAQSASTTAAKQGEAMASGIAASQNVPFPLNIIALAATVSSLVAAFASMAKFETGGVVGGTSFAGDKMMIRVNSGEEVLRRDDPRHAYNLGTARASGGSDRIIIPTARIRKGDIYISYQEAQKEIGKRT